MMNSIVRPWRKGESGRLISELPIKNELLEASVLEVANEVLLVTGCDVHLTGAAVTDLSRFMSDAAVILAGGVITI